MLGSIRKVFKLIEINPESIQFRKEEFIGQNIIDALRNEPKKCPVVTAADFTDYCVSKNLPTSAHAMVTAGALKGLEFNPTNTILADQWFIKCKNSYGNDPTQPGDIHYITYKDIGLNFFCKLDQSDLFSLTDVKTHVKSFEIGFELEDP